MSARPFAAGRRRLRPGTPVLLGGVAYVLPPLLTRGRPSFPLQRAPEIVGHLATMLTWRAAHIARGTAADAWVDDFPKAAAVGVVHGALTLNHPAVPAAVVARALTRVTLDFLLCAALGLPLPDRPAALRSATKRRT